MLLEVTIVALLAAFRVVVVVFLLVTMPCFPAPRFIALSRLTGDVMAARFSVGVRHVVVTD